MANGDPGPANQRMIVTTVKISALVSTNSRPVLAAISPVDITGLLMRELLDFAGVRS
jgi:hypothetical protein